MEKYWRQFFRLDCLEQILFVAFETSCCDYKGPSTAAGLLERFSEDGREPPRHHWLYWNSVVTKRSDSKNKQLLFCGSHLRVNIPGKAERQLDWDVFALPGLSTADLSNCNAAWRVWNAMLRCWLPRPTVFQRCRHQLKAGTGPGADGKPYPGQSGATSTPIHVV